MFGTRALRHGIRHLARYFSLSLGLLCVNPFTATGCKNFRAEKCPHKPAKQYSFRSYNKLMCFLYVCLLTEILSCQCEKANKKTYEFQISHFYWPFSSDSMSVKGLNCCRAHRLPFGFLTLLLAYTLYCCRMCFYIDVKRKF